MLQVYFRPTAEDYARYLSCAQSMLQCVTDDAEVSAYSQSSTSRIFQAAVPTSHPRLASPRLRSPILPSLPLLSLQSLLRFPPPSSSPPRAIAQPAVKAPGA